MGPLKMVHLRKHGICLANQMSQTHLDTSSGMAKSASTAQSPLIDYAWQQKLKLTIIHDNAVMKQ